MRIVLVSSGTTALQFASDLSQDNDVSIVHDGEEGRTELEKLDVDLIDGTGSDTAALTRAGIAEADHLIACSRFDETNIIACLTARQLGPANTICFISKSDYLRTFGTEGESSRIGIDRLVWPARMLADKIERILTVPGATDVGSFARGRISSVEYRLREGGPLAGRPLAEIRGLPPGVLIVAVTRGEEWFVPRGPSVLQVGDRVAFMGRTEAMRQLAGWFTEHFGEKRSGDVVIVGGGTVGLCLAQALELDPKARPKIIEQDETRCAEIAAELHRSLVLHGDGCDVDLLETEQVHEASALVAVTDSDEKNLLASLLGRQLGIARVVTRVSHASHRGIFERVGIDVPLSARGAATEAVLHMIRHGKVDLLATMGEGHGEVVQITLPPGFTPTPLKELVMPPDSLIAAIERTNDALVPGGATLIGPGDRCLVICNVERVQEVLKALLS